MASLITCPHCGTRPKEEFSIRGAALARPHPAASEEDWHAYVYLRENPKGRYQEYWHHAAGCRRWLIVDRDNVTHDVFSVVDAAAIREPSE
ncbi:MULTISPECIES: sarcosine oxidase subunit delta [Rhizobiaceae]|jgi:sarcosine oxidase subunit delta|uniref:Sarcosine oxidase subunit delta n=1 Tax=Aliirhizobium cellulosilyticum TaxID=393664 RepID=A0A7W6WNB3_9HYPH|nr:MULTISPECIES: sarcosine oxidase subunit delta [Rhizobium/Agrobacterium group]MBB4346906.1 sarcosine oxidase subunit delta [Rhizobium cellulosilyticum]MBB4410700.1 sarcosine oxidase subunit delta [Rhizobium cellulosilyticum]MBB4445388.1 sarcosine oxidase subunit delta [Rhizobium cellulosilyticum]MBO0139614.1 sarcosine oxidase subunit delta [Agrobacterium sp. Ap1]